MWAMGWGVVSTCKRHVVGCQWNLRLNAMCGLRCPLRDIWWAVMFDMGCVVMWAMVWDVVWDMGCHV